MPTTSNPTATASAPLRLHLFGSFSAETGSARLPTRQAQLLLAYLVLHPEPHSREKLAGLLWGDVPDADARHSLRTAINTLRKVLGEPLLLADRETVQINPAFPIWVDVRVFENGLKGLVGAPTDRVAATLDLYEGDLLSAFYEDWVLLEREHYRRHYLEALLQLSQRLRSQSDYPRAIEFARRALASDPANERAHQQLMFCYLAAGDRTAALEQYQECRRCLQEELAAEPSPETGALYEWIKQADTGVKTREGLVTNLPVPLTSFVGRKQELAQIETLLSGEAAVRPTVRLLTLTGAGGSGKTRLAIQVGWDLLKCFQDGVWWVDYAALMNEGLVPQTAARALGVRELADEVPVDTLKNHLLSKQLLLILDNCEHLVDACSELARALLTACPGVKILATSRASLGLAGERVWYVPTLSVPDPRRAPSESELAEYDGIRLFMERAAAVKPDFSLSPHNASRIIEICAQLDGIPLALELAAARLRLLTVTQIAERLVDRFGLLAGGSRAALPRHRTLRATLDWSYGLLSEQERCLFQRVSVFAGGWTLEAAESVGGERQDAETRGITASPCRRVAVSSFEILDLLSQLVDKSLVIVQGDGQEARYRMLETVRQYAAERLCESGEQGEVRRGHALYFAELAEKAEQALQSAAMGAWLEQLEVEHDNLRAALQWSLENDPTGMAWRFAGALGAFWRKRGYLREGSASIERLLGHGQSVSPELKVKAMAPAAWLARDLGDYRRAISLQEESLQVFRSIGDKLGAAEILIQRGVLGIYQNDFASAITFLEESLSLYQEADSRRGCALASLFLAHAAMFNMQWDERARARCDQALVFFQASEDATEEAHAHIVLGSAFQIFDREETSARKHLEEAVRICRNAGDKRQLGWSTMALSCILFLQGKWEEAWDVNRKALKLAVDLGEKTITVNTIVYAGLIAAQHRQAARGARLLACALTAGESFGWRPTPHVLFSINPGRDAMQAALGPEAFAQAWAAGQAMSLERGIGDVLG